MERKVRQGHGGGLGGCSLSVARRVGYWEGADGAGLTTSLSKVERSPWSVFKNDLE